MKKFLPFLIALFAGIAQGYSLAPANEWLQLAALAVLFFIFAGLRTAKAGFLAGLFFGIGWFVTSLAWLYVSVHDYGYQPPVFAAFVVFIFSCYLALYPAAVGALCAWSMKRGSSAGLMLLAIAPAAWGLTEWLRGVLFSGFPWSAVSYAHVDGSLSAFAPICGADGINFLAAFISGCAALLLLERKNLKGIAVSCAGKRTDRFARNYFSDTASAAETGNLEEIYARHQWQRRFDVRRLFARRRRIPQHGRSG